MDELLLQADHIKKSFGPRTILDIEKLEIFAHDRIGLIGENGAGKSTLLSILSGEAEADAANIRRFCAISVIHQMGTSSDLLDERERRLFRSEDNRAGLSGGEQTRRRIAAALSDNTALLFADEPTTDLDAEGTSVLKKELSAYRGALVLISHDRSLLNSLCTRIWYLEGGKISEFPGNYNAFQEELKRRRDFQQFEYDQYRREEARLKASVQRFREMSQQVKKAPTRMGNSEARLHKREATDAILRLSHAGNIMTHRMEHLEKKERPSDLPDIRMAFGSHTPITAKTALTVQRLSLKAGDKVLLKNADFTVPTGSHTALLGVNGCGKTTLLRLLCAPDGLSSEIAYNGKVRFNPAVRIGRFDQNHEQTLLPNFSALENAMRTSVLDDSDVRTTFARMNMRGDNVFKPVSVLSGGERAKTAMVKLLVSDINVLVLDEPTNHLDVFTTEALEALLKNYVGTLLFVSHDKAFTESVADRLLLMHDGTLETFEGTLQQKEARDLRDVRSESLKLEITTLEMRMAALSLRLSAPKKGDDPTKLNAEYQSLMDELRIKKQQLSE